MSNQTLQEAPKVDIRQQGNTLDLAENFAVRPNAENAKILSEVLAEINLEKGIYSQIEFKNPKTGVSTKLNCSLSKTNGQYLLVSSGYSGYSGSQIMPSKEDQIVGVAKIEIVGKEDAIISLYKKIDSFQTALESARGQMVRIFSDRHNSEEFLIQSIDRQGVVTAVKMDRLGAQEEVSFQISRNKCYFAQGTEDEYSQPITAIHRLSSHLTLNRISNSEGIVAPELPVLGQKGQIVDQISALDLIAKGTEVTIKIKIDNYHTQEIDLKTNWLGFKAGQIIVGNPRVLAGVSSYPLENVLELRTSPQDQDQKDIATLFKATSKPDKRIPGSTMVEIRPVIAGASFDFKVIDTLYAIK